MNMEMDGDGAAKRCVASIQSSLQPRVAVKKYKEKTFVHSSVWKFSNPMVANQKKIRCHHIQASIAEVQRCTGVILNVPKAAVWIDVVMFREGSSKSIESF